MNAVNFLKVAMVSASLAVPLRAVAQEPHQNAAVNIAEIMARGGMPNRVHVFEDYETEIEKRWWLRGRPETQQVPRPLVAGERNVRACRATETKDFDRKMGDQSKLYKAVIFNPVPGPPMGKNTRLGFRYRLSGTGTLRVQIYSLTNNYHRHLFLTDLPQDTWQSATVDMTQARRPDGSGGPLSENERIDDIQFYIAPDADLWIDDIVLYDAGNIDEKRSFPCRVIFTGWFDTGKQGKEWPGDFQIVPHQKPRTWKTAQSVKKPDSESPFIRVHLRGQRQLGDVTMLQFRYHLTGAEAMQVELSNSRSTFRIGRKVEGLKQRAWGEAIVSFEKIESNRASMPITVDNIEFQLPKSASLQVDDVLLYVDSAQPKTH